MAMTYAYIHVFSVIHLMCMDHYDIFAVFAGCIIRCAIVRVFDKVGCANLWLVI